MIFQRQHHHIESWLLWLRLHLLERVDPSSLLRPRHHPDQRDLRPRNQLHRPVFRYWGVTLPKWKLHWWSWGLQTESWVEGSRKRRREEETHFIQTLLGIQVVHTSMLGSLPQSLLLSSNLSEEETGALQLDELLHRWKYCLFFILFATFQATPAPNPATSPMAIGVAKCRKSQFLTPPSWTVTPTPIPVSNLKLPQSLPLNDIFCQLFSAA